MCIMSMIHDHYNPLIPDPFNPHKPIGPAVPPSPTTTPPAGWFTPATPTPSIDFGSAAAVAELRKLIAEFREAVEKAKRLDVLTGQPDCVDPNKAKLEDRVTALEELLSKMAPARRKRGKRKAAK